MDYEYVVCGGFIFIKVENCYFFFQKKQQDYIYFDDLLLKQLIIFINVCMSDVSSWSKS